MVVRPNPDDDEVNELEETPDSPEADPEPERDPTPGDAKPDPKTDPPTPQS
jgi:hypothetical protein